MDFRAKPKHQNSEFEMYELQAVARALDIEKRLAHQVFNIHEKASRLLEDNHDPGVVEYLQDDFVEKQSDIIRKFSGYAVDLRSLLDQKDTSLSLYMFDEYLQKQ